MEKRKLSLKDSSVAFLLAFAISQVAIIFGQLIVRTILTLCNFSTTKIVAFMQGSVGYTITAMFQLGSFVGLFIYYCYKTTLKTECETKKVKPLHVLLFITIGIITMWSLSYFINYYTLVLNLGGKSSSTISYSLSNTKNYIISLISLAVFPAIGEELLFRGIILNGLKTKGKLFAIILSSIMFTVFHFNLSQLFYPLLFGMILGSAYIFTRNIFVPILIHFINNALNITIQYFSKEGMFTNSTINIILMIVGCVIYLCLLSLILYMLYRQEKKETLEASTLINLNSNNENKQINPSVKSSALKAKTIQKASIKNFNFRFYKSEKFWIYFPLIIMGILYIIITTFGA